MTFEHAIQTGIPSPVLVTPHHSQAKGKDLSLELLKFVAMILIINVHSYMMYHPNTKCLLLAVRLVMHYSCFVLDTHCFLAE